MANEMSFELSKLALKDINDIWLFTVEQWSVNQANIYYKQLFKSIDSICENPEIGKSIAEVKMDHRMLVVKTHLIIYKVQKHHIYIDRILHQSMDIDAEM